ncbi:MAG: DNA methyltransferase [Candidatus Parvarchaeota archaeon]
MSVEEGIKFGLEFWVERLKQNGFIIHDNIVQIDEKHIGGLKVKKSHLLFDNGLVNIYFLETEDIKKGSLIRAARQFTKNRPLKNIFIFSDGNDSLLVMFPKDYDGEAKILHLEGGKLYYTDEIALGSIVYSNDIQKIAHDFENTFLPYEKVREDFFIQYKEKFQKLVKTLTNAGMDTKQAYQYSQRFLGRMMFLYFLQKKGWLGGNRKFIDTIKDYKHLNSIFYDGLNNPNNKYGLPFLNGSLFDPEDYVKDLESKLEPEMTQFFFDVRSFLNKYNFTVEESMPLEKEVGIDPYLLGTVLERMLPENERGSKGTFYTPPPEMLFIIRRAISSYLANNGIDASDSIKDNEFIDGIDRYIEHLSETRNYSELDVFKKLLINATVVDPAVGSGGFLVTYMDVVSNIINRAEEAVMGEGEVTHSKLIKKDLMKNLYGFDIESEAVEIARLRMWLSFVIDEEKPTPLDNLDLNIVTVDDSLSKDNIKVTFEKPEEVMSLMEKINSYRGEHNPEKKKELKKQINDIRKKLYGNSYENLNSYLSGKKADIIVMNPPYVRKESIPKDRKEYYLKTYTIDSDSRREKGEQDADQATVDTGKRPKKLTPKIDAKSDLYVYFFMRAVDLLSDKGVAAVISSDKWLETGYGESLQLFLKNKLLAVYGQRERSFGADINTVISVFTKKASSQFIHFTYLERYSSTSVENDVVLDRNNLSVGKWFYLRAPKLFMEKIYPKLTHKLSDFAEIKRGFTTGANDFFYMKDVSSQYEMDYINNPKKFEEWGVKAKNEKELKEQGLLYIENNNKQRFVIELKDTVKIIKSPKQLKRYFNDSNIIDTLCFYTSSPGNLSKKYIMVGESEKYNERSTCKGRKPWYTLSDLKPSRIFLIGMPRNRFFSPVFNEEVLCDAQLYAVYPATDSVVTYLNSTLFYFFVELFGRRMGGGGGTLEIKVEDYKEIPVPDLNIYLTGFKRVLDRDIAPYSEEVKMKDRQEMDKAILEGIGIYDVDLNVLYREFVRLVDDRLMKAGRPAKSKKQNMEGKND